MNVNFTRLSQPTQEAILKVLKDVNDKNLKFNKSPDSTYNIILSNGLKIFITKLEYNIKVNLSHPDFGNIIILSKDFMTIPWLNKSSKYWRITDALYETVVNQSNKNVEDSIIKVMDELK